MIKMPHLETEPAPSSDAWKTFGPMPYALTSARRRPQILAHSERVLWSGTESSVCRQVGSKSFSFTRSISHKYYRL